MRRLYSVCCALLLPVLAGAQSREVYFTSNPTLTPDGKTVIFSYEGDLWKTDINSNAATRLTGMQGEETSPRVSPDGQWLAFSANQYGNNDVYVMPLAGGEIRQITYNDANDDMESWSWDSKTIYFTSNRYNNFSAYKVGREGGTPVRLFGNYFNTINGLVEHPKTGELFFNDTWESYRFPQRKRYKGAYNPDIESYNPKTKAFKQYTDWEGKDFWTSIDAKGNVYFVSDEANGEYNLYTFINGKKTGLTKYSTSIKRPQVSANGEKVVFERDYQMYVYDVASKDVKKLNINTFRNNILPKLQEFEVAGKIESADISPDGKKLAFVSRGEIFVSDIEGKFIRQIQRGTGERAVEIKWLPDNRSLLYTRTVGGYPNLFTIAADGNGTEKQLTNDKGSCRLLVANKTHTQAVYISGRNEVRLIDLKTLESKTIAKDELWGFQNAAPGFSPNGEYIVYSPYRNFEQEIFVYNTKTGKSTNLTNTGVTETDPVWSPDGKYIYFTSSRTQPSYPYGMQNAHVYRMPLQKFDEPYRLDKFNDLFKETKKDSVAPDVNKNKKPDEKKPIVQLPVPKAPAGIEINTEDIMKRVERISPAFGSQGSPDVIQRGEKTFLFFTSDQAEGRRGLYRTTIEPFEANKTEKVQQAPDMFGYDLIKAGDKYFMLAGGSLYKVNMDANRLDKMEIGYKFNRNLEGEFAQMFDEAWAGLDENYYDGNFHGIDWKKTHDEYAKYVPYVTNRADLRLLLNDMLGELNSSHMGFSSSGAEERMVGRYRTMETGILFDNDAPYKVTGITKNSNADRKGLDIQAGDKLVAVNGTPVNENMDRSHYFTKPSLDNELTLTLERAGKKVLVKVHPESTAKLKGELYDDWIEHNKKEVEQKSKNRIAYVYMKDMTGNSLEDFLTDMAAEAYSKDALILDIRYNTGGNVHDAVLQLLSRKPYLQWQYRGGQRTGQPNFAPSGKPIVLLINEQTLSDGEMTSAGFKQLGLGKIIGTETYRWIIFTSGKGLVDGSFYRIPAWGCFTLDGKDIEKTGVAPDIAVKTSFVDRLNNNDPQLDKAISEIMKELK